MSRDSTGRRCGEASVKTVAMPRGSLALVQVDPRSVHPVLAEGIRSPGGFIYRNAKGAWTLRWVVPRSPLARAGLRSGMTLTAINGKPLGKKDICPANKLLRNPRGTRLTLQVRELARPVTVVY